MKRSSAGCVMRHGGDVLYSDVLKQLEVRAESNPNAMAILAPGRPPLTYGALAGFVKTTIQRLEELGLTRGDRIAIVLPNGAEAATCWLSITAGAVSAPLNPMYTAAEFKSYFHMLSPKAVVVESGSRSPVIDVADSMGVPILHLKPIDADAAGIFQLTGSACERTTSKADCEKLEEPALVLHTSGSTAHPKLVVLTHRNLCSSARNIVESLGLEPLDRCLNIMPLFHVHGLIGAVLASLTAGASVVCTPGLNAVDFFDWLDQFCPTWFTAVPTMHQSILMQARHREGTIRNPSLRFIRSCSSALPPKVMTELEVLFQVPVVEAYGMTEASHQIAVNRLPPGARKPGSVGAPAGCEIAVVGESGEAVPAGQVGDVIIRGPNVITAYDKNPEIHARSFVDGWLCTGDQGRFDADGYLFLIGRKEEIINRGGEKISPREIVETLVQHSMVREAAAFGIPDASLGEDVAAAVTLSDASRIGRQELIEGELQDFLAGRLASFKVPRRIFIVADIPKGPTGKPQPSVLARRLIPHLWGPLVSRNGKLSSEPRSPIEQSLAKIWKEVLGLDTVGIHDDFFQLGGDSIFAAQIVSRIGQKFGVAVPMFRIFSRPNIHGLGEWLELALKRGTQDFEPLKRLSRPERLPLSYEQQRLWFLAQMEGASEAYHIHAAFHLKGRLDVGALRRALDRVVARHEVLRSTFVVVEGGPVQRIGRSQSHGFQMMEVDAREAEDRPRANLGRMIAEEMNARFDLENGPAVRGKLIRQADDEFLLLITLHHLIADGWSVGLLVKEVSVLYSTFQRGEADRLPKLPLQYADYAVWQRKWIADEILLQQADYWQRRLAGAPALLELPTDYPRPARQGYLGSYVPIILNEKLTADLKELSSREEATLFMILLAAWGVLLRRLSGQQDLVVGTAVATRRREEIEALIGFFVNTLALRLDLSNSPTLHELMQQVKGLVVEAQDNQDIPFERVVDIVRPQRNLSYSPIFQVMFAWQNAPKGLLVLPGMEIRPMQEEDSGYRTAKFDLSLSLQESSDKITGGLRYAAVLFEQGTVERFLSYYRRILETMAAAGGSLRVNELSMLAEPEQRQLLYEWNNTDACIDDAGVHELFEQQAHRAPDAVAVICRDAVLSYGELNAQANRLACHLLQFGVKPEARVAIWLERGAEMVVALLGILKAGCAYVPIDPGSPDQRVKYILEDSNSAALVTQSDLQGRLSAWGATLPILAMQIQQGWQQQHELDRRVADVSPSNLAYVMYTSGSTGLPKGVMVEHRQISNYVAAVWDRLNRPAGWSFGLVSTLAADLGNTMLFPSLLRGGVLHVLSSSDAADPDRFEACCRDRCIDCVKITPSHLQALLEDARADAIPRRSLISGGERLTGELLDTIRSLRAECCIYNHYGPTECTVGAVSADITGWTQSPTDRNIPLGRPMNNMRVYILDSHFNVAPVGVTGEIYISGMGLSRGYLNRPDLTAERFVPDPFAQASGSRMYRTGDLGRWRRDGMSEFLGRNDFQAKIRGYRIEPREIEVSLAEHPEVREAVVLVREDVRQQNHLVAYYTRRAQNGHDTRSLGGEELRKHLSARLPEYMVPMVYVCLERIPLTANGKLDRQALPQVDGDAYSARQYEEPRGEIEEAVAGIWSELLGVQHVGRYDNFFELGGHSLLAVRVIGRIRQRLGMAVTIGDLFASPSLLSFAAAVESSAKSKLPAITRAERSGRLPLSFAQQRLWFLAQLEGGSKAYHIPIGLRLKGRLDRAALRSALNRVVERHEALRTTFVAIDGEGMQQIASIGESCFHLAEQDLRAASDVNGRLKSVMEEEVRAPFDLNNGPLIRGRLVDLDDQEHVLLITMHHIVSDGWSREVLFRELNVLYGAYVRGEPDPLPELEVQYADYAIWQRTWIEGVVLRGQVGYWKELLAGAPARLDLPADYPRPAQQDYAGAVREFVLDAELTARLKELSRRNKTTLYMTLLAGWATLLARLSDQRDIVVGTPVANRGRAEIEKLIGFFVNTLAMRVNLDGWPTVKQLLAQVKSRSSTAQQHQDVPFEQVVEAVRPERSLTHSPLFQTMFAWQNAPEPSVELVGLEGSLIRPVYEVAKFDLTLMLREAGGKIVGGVEYATSLFRRETVERYLGFLRKLLDGMVQGETQAVDRLEILSEGERNQILYEWNQTGVACQEKCVHELFEESVANAPESIALLFEECQLTYAELNKRANQLANYLRNHGVSPERRVGIFLDRGVEMLVGVLAVLKAGAAYVPLDPGYPEERLLFMAEDSQLSAILTHSSLRERLKWSEGQIISLDRDWAVIGLERAENPRAQIAAKNLAYVIYTSGSTGRPKGVGMPHGALVNLFLWQGEALRVTNAPRTLQFSSLSFDVSAHEAFTTWLLGGTLALISEEIRQHIRGLLALLEKEKIDTLFPPFVLLQQIAYQCDEEGRYPQSLKQVLSTAEPLQISRVVRKMFAELDGCRLYNEYGPTETHVVTAAAMTGPVDLWVELPPIGRPVANTQMYVLDREMAPVAVGVAGEIYIGGANLARGYLNRPSLTAERFVPNPYGNKGGERLYRTGDMGKFESDGTLRCLGRSDHQIKIRGYRIEPGEIETVLEEYEGIQQVAVVAREDQAGDKRLVAYYTVKPIATGDGKAESIPDAAYLRAHLCTRLPAYMVPAAYVRLDALPLTPSGKLDRKSLPTLDIDAYAFRGYEAPLGQIEITLAAIWSDLLHLDRVGRQDNFFHLGGHSLLVLRMASRIWKEFQAEISPLSIFQKPTLETLAEQIERQRQELPSDNTAVIERVHPRNQMPLSFNQEGFLFRVWWEGAQRLKAPAHNLALALHLKGNLDRRRMEAAVTEIVRRHEVLRTSFSGTREAVDVHMLSSMAQKFLDIGVLRRTVDGGSSEEARQEPFIQTVHPAATVSILSRSLDTLENDLQEQEISRIVSEEQQKPFLYDNPPLLRLLLLKKSETSHLLVFVVSHLVADRWSLEILQREFVSLYHSYSLSAAPTLPDLPVQYADFAAWQKKKVLTDQYKDAISYWRSRVREYPVFTMDQLPFVARPAIAEPAALERVSVSFDPRAVMEFTRRKGITPYVFSVAALHVLLYRYTGITKTATWGNFANRARPELESLVGWFSNAHLLCLDLSGDPTFDDLLERTSRTVAEITGSRSLPTLLLWSNVLHREIRQHKGEMAEERHILFDLVTRENRAVATGDLICEPAVFPTRATTNFGVNLIAEMSDQEMRFTAVGRIGARAMRKLVTDLWGVLERIAVFYKKPISLLAKEIPAIEPPNSGENREPHY